jgi:Flp pilus assembly protein TadG
MSGQSLPRSRDGKSERGAAAVEFALVTPLLVGLVFGIISYGYMLSFRQGISQSAAEGARAAAVSPAAMTLTDKESAARTAVNRALQSYGVTCSGTSLVKDSDTVGTCSVTINTCTNNSTRSCASVRVNYAYRDHPLLPSFPGLGGSLPEKLDYTAVAEVS